MELSQCDSASWNITKNTETIERAMTLAAERAAQPSQKPSQSEESVERSRQVQALIEERRSLILDGTLSGVEKKSARTKICKHLQALHGQIMLKQKKEDQRRFEQILRFTRNCSHKEEYEARPDCKYVGF